jgi:hypothetical protein
MLSNSDLNPLAYYASKPLRLDEMPIGIGEPYLLEISKQLLCLLDDLKRIY